MKDARELLGLLTVKVQRFEISQSGFDPITPQDVAHAVALIHSPPARLYARVKYAQQNEFASELAMELLYHCSRIDGFTTWRGRSGNLQSFCALALYEAVHPNICPWCHGTKEAIVNSKKIQCDGCHGSGVRYLTDPDRAKMVNIAKQSFYETWSDRYKSIQGIVLKWEDIVYGALNRRLSQT